MCMSEDVVVESTFVKSVGSAVRNQACSKNTYALILMSGLMYASYVISLSRRKVKAWFLPPLFCFVFVFVFCLFFFFCGGWGMCFRITSSYLGFWTLFSNSLSPTAKSILFVKNMTPWDLFPPFCPGSKDVCETGRLLLWLIKSYRLRARQVVSEGSGLEVPG